MNFRMFQLKKQDQRQLKTVDMIQINNTEKDAIALSIWMEIQCCWPIGEPQDRNLTVTDNKNMTTKSYFTPFTWESNGDGWVFVKTALSLHPLSSFNFPEGHLKHPTKRIYFYSFHKMTDLTTCWRRGRRSPGHCWWRWCCQKGSRHQRRR